MNPALFQAFERARRVWPTVPVAPDGFASYLASKLPPGVSQAEGLASLRVDELYLAYACLCGVAAALTVFEQRYMPVAVRAVQGIDAPQHARDEVVQGVRAKLLVGTPERAAALSQYAGRGSLESWVRVTAVRAALNNLRAGRREVPAGDAILVAQAASDDAELELIRQRYRAELEGAMASAFERLASDQRELLRLYVLDGLTLEELARVHDVNPSTVSRWLARIRDKLASDARRHFADRCGLSQGECDSVMRALESGMHLSVSRLLNSPT